MPMATSATWKWWSPTWRNYEPRERTARARIRIQGLFVVVAKNPDQAMHELAPHFHHVNNFYGQWLNEDRAATGFGESVVLQPMSLEAFKGSGILRILTPDQAIQLFNDMRSKAAVEHFMMMLPPGIPASNSASTPKFSPRKSSRRFANIRSA